MLTAIIILCLTCFFIVSSVFLFPNIKIGKISIPSTAVFSLLGALLMLIFGVVSPLTVWRNLTANTAINPIKILVLFLSMTILSVFLDELGFFSYLAEKVLSLAKNSAKKLFLYLYVAVSVLTVFTSNDIIVLTFTPLICFFAKRVEVNPMPFLFCEFVAANTFSMMLVIGNPTNIYLATSAGVNFFSYFLVMCAPTIVAGVVAYLIMYFLFRKQLSVPLKVNESRKGDTKILDKTLLIIGVIFLSVAIILLAIASYVGVEGWLFCLIICLSEIIVFAVIRKSKRQNLRPIISALKRAPYELVPFVLSMFVVVLGVTSVGLSKIIGDFLSKFNSVFSFGIASFFTANLINNIPMSVLFSFISGNNLSAVYASIIGSNIGAYFTPIGALAGIMWCNMLKIYGVKLSFKDFFIKGAIISIPTILSALLTLFIII